MAVLWEFLSRLASFNCCWSIFLFPTDNCLVKRKKVQNVMKLLPPYYFKHLMSIYTKIATSDVVSALLYHRSYRVRDPYRPFWIFTEITADYSFPDFRSPFPAPRSSFPVPRTPLSAPRSPFLLLVTSLAWVKSEIKQHPKFVFLEYWWTNTGFQSKALTEVVLNGDMPQYLIHTSFENQLATLVVCLQ